MGAVEALKFAKARVGYYAPDDELPGSEAGRWLAKKLNQAWLKGRSTDIWWCMCFASMCTYEGGGTLPGGPSFNTDYTASAAAREGRLVGKSHIQAGDVVIFDWNWNSQATDHVGIAVRNHDGWVETIEGNTSPGDAGSQSAGNGVWERRRSWEDVRYVVRPDWGDGGAPSAEDVKAAFVKIDGIWGEGTTGGAQAAFGFPVDRVVSSQNVKHAAANPGLGSGWEWVPEAEAEGSQLIGRLQAYWGVPEGRRDYLFGPDTICHMQEFYGISPDGFLEDPSSTVIAFQKDLNRKNGW